MFRKATVQYEKSNEEAISQGKMQRFAIEDTSGHVTQLLLTTVTKNQVSPYVQHGH